jgi:Spy/CpxP family protein refolding chaperone
MRSLTAFVLVGTVLFATTAMAQSAADTNMEILKQKIKADKKLLVASNMELSDGEAKQFWPLYDGYQKELGQINQRLEKTIMEYAEAYKKGSVPNDTAKKLLNEVLAIEEAEVKLKRSYAEKLGKVLPTTKVARYVQIENKIRALVKAELAQQIPLVY